MTIHWHMHRFDDLSPRQLYQIMQLRQSVFIVEQNCPYHDLDGKDLESLHLSAWRDNNLVAYIRILPPEIHDSGCPSIGRVCNAASVRGTGIGRELMQRGLKLVQAHWPGRDCQIGAQAYLQKFYESLGFVINGDGYLEDDIAHFPMRWSASA